MLSRWTTLSAYLVLMLSIVGFEGSSAGPISRSKTGTLFRRTMPETRLTQNLIRDFSLSSNESSVDPNVFKAAKKKSDNQDDGDTLAFPHVKSLEGLKEANFGSNNKTIRGINIGSWLVLENWQNPSLFLTPDLMDKDIPDEWTYTSTLGPDESTRRLKEHYDSWLSSEDFRKMTTLGLNTVRIPVGYWAFVHNPSEPYVSGIQIDALTHALNWARDNSLDVVLDLHGVPGSQNGFDNSGHKGPIHFGDSQENSDKAIDALIKMVEMFVNDPIYGGVVKAITPVNEPRVGENLIPLPFLKEYYRTAYAAIRNAVDPVKALSIPTVLFSDAFLDLSSWDSFFSQDYFETGSYAIDFHSYQAWEPLRSLSLDGHVHQACTTGDYLAKFNDKHPIVVGEFSLGIETRCVPYKPCKDRTMMDDVYTLNSDAQNLFARRYWEAQTVSFEDNARGWIFWSWKAESTAAWSYQASVDQGWIPKDPTDKVFPLSKDEQKKQNNCIAKQPNSELTFATRRP